MSAWAEAQKQCCFRSEAVQLLGWKERRSGGVDVYVAASQMEVPIALFRGQQDMHRRALNEANTSLVPTSVNLQLVFHHAEPEL